VIQLWSSESSQPTLRPPRGMGLGKVPAPTYLYMVERARPVFSITALSLRMRMICSPMLFVSRS